MQTVIAGFARARYLTVFATALLAAPIGAANAQDEDPESIAGMLRDGGYVLAMRHASAESEPPERASGRNRNAERELSELGTAHAIAMGYAFRQLDISIGEVQSSPAFRALDTAFHLGYEAVPADELASSNEHGDWLRAVASQAPAAGTNRLLITHAPNLRAAFGDAAANIRDGEVLVVRPLEGDFEVVGRVTPREWAVLGVNSDS